VFLGIHYGFSLVVVQGYWRWCQRICRINP